MSRISRSKIVLTFGILTFGLSIQAKETGIFVPSSKIDGVNYVNDLQDNWTDGAPVAGDTVMLQYDTKTPYVTNSAPVYLQNLKVASKDFYLKSAYPFYFDAPEGEVSTVSFTNSKMQVKYFGDMYFNAPVAWTGGGAATTFPLLMDGSFVFNQSVKLTGQLFGSGSDATLRIPTLTGYTVNDTYGALSANSARIIVTNTANFGGTVWLNNGTLEHGCGDALPESEGVETIRVTEGLVSWFDASDESTITFVNGNHVAEWRDKAADRKATPAIGSQTPIWRENELGALPTVDFGPGTGYGGDTRPGYGAVGPLAFDTMLTGFKTVFYVLDSSTGGGWLLPAVDDGHRNLIRGSSRGYDQTDRWIESSSPAIEGLSMRVNGRTVEPTAALPGGTYEIIALTRTEAFPNALAGFAFDEKTKSSNLNSKRSGGQRIAEFLAYDRVLSETEMRSVEKYLNEKWLSGRTDLRFVRTRGVSTLNVADASDHEVHLSHYVGSGAVVKKGAGTLVLDHPRDVVDRIELEGGTLAIESDKSLARADGISAGLSADGVILHVDASDATSISKNELGEVSEWRDLSGSGNKFGPGVEGTIVGRCPVLRASLDNGKPVVDFGGYSGSDYQEQVFMDLKTHIETAQTVLLVADCRFGGGHLLADTSSGTGSDFHRGNLAVGNQFSAMTYGMGAAWGNAPGEIWVDLNTVDPMRDSVPRTLQVISFTDRGKDAKRKIGRIGMDRAQKNRAGGIAVGELVVYNRTLSDAELASAVKYLRDKWQDVPTPTLRTVEATGIATLDARTNIVVDTISGDGVLIAKGGTITVNGFADFSGRLASAGGTWKFVNKGTAPESNPVTEGLLAHFDFSDTDSVTTNASGKVTSIRSQNDISLTADAPSGCEAPYLAGGATVNGRFVMGSAGKNTRRGVIMSTAFTNVHTAISVVCPTNGSGGKLYGTTTIDNAGFERDISSPSMPLFRAKNGDYGQSYLSSVDAWRNGKAIQADAEGYADGYQTITTIWPNRMCLDELGIYGTASNAGGGLIYGEVLVWDRCLSDNERKQVEAYLQAKWFGKAVHGYQVSDKSGANGVDTTYGAAVVEVSSGNEGTVGYVTGSGAFVKTGGGTLTVEGSVSELTGDLVVEAGSLVYGATMVSTDALPLSKGLIAHFDANSNVTTNENGTVTAWQSKAGDATYGDYTATRCFPDDTATPKRKDYPKLVLDATNGLACVDFGKKGTDQSNGLWFDTDTYSDSLVSETSGGATYTYATIPDCKSILMAFNSEKGGGFVVGNVGGDYYHRQNADCKLERGLFGTGVLGFSSAYLDMEQVGQCESNVLNGAWQMMEVYKTSKANVAGFAHDRFLRMGDRTGGNKIGEAVFFNRILTDEEKLRMRMYLYNRWYRKVAPGSGSLDKMYEHSPSCASLKVAAGASLVLDGYVQTVSNLVCGTGGAISGGDVQVAHQLTVQSGAPLVVSGKVSFADGCSVEVGELTAAGTWKVLSADSIEGLATQKVGTCLIKGRLCPVTIQVTDKDIFLMVGDPGLLVIIR